MLYLDDDINGFSLDEALPQLPAWRREAALRHRREADRRLSVAAYRLLCRGLRAEYGITEPPAFTYAEGGKPCIKGRPDIHFNLSHCPAAALCAISPAAANRIPHRPIRPPPFPAHTFKVCSPGRVYAWGC